MSRLLFLFLSVLSPVFVFSQRPNQPGGNGKELTGSISGTLLDSISGEPISYATVGVIDFETDSIINGAIADDEGDFKVKDLPPGRYELQISFIGYAALTIDDIMLTPKRPDYNAGKIMLTPENKLLQEVRVVGQAALIEAKPDKLVYNAERDVTSRGGDASDVLRKVPLLTVDLDGNVSMRGSGNIRILINGRPSSIFNNNIADALKMMPADQIKSVEVITAPSAKYDAEGTAGIINIITRKKNIEGLAGSVDVTGGTRANRGNVNLNYGKGRLGITASGGGHYNWPQTGTTEILRETRNELGITTLTQDGTSESSRLGFRSHAGFEYKANAFSSINGSFSYRGHKSTNLNDIESFYYQAQSVLLEQYERESDAESKRGGWDAELEYERKFPQEDREWSIALEVDRDTDHSNSFYDLTYTVPANAADALEQNLDDGRNYEYIAETDYVQPISKHVKIETGIRARLRGIESDFEYRTYDPDLERWLSDPERTDIFYYDQNVYAAYVSGTFELGEMTSIITGLRAEMTDLAGDFENFNSNFENTYTNLLPNFTIAQRTGEYNQLRLSYNQRIQRPNQRHINPFVDYNDNRDISFGNPSLTPELVHQVEIATNLFIKESMLSLSVYGRRTEDLIESLLRVNEDGVSETTFENFGIRSAAGFNLFGTVSIGKSFSIQGGTDFNFWEIKGMLEDEDLSNSGYDYNARLNLSWSLTETLKVEGFGFFRSPSFSVQGKTPSWSTMSVGVRKEFFDKKYHPNWHCNVGMIN